MLCVREKFLQRLYCSIAMVLALLSVVILSRNLIPLVSVLLAYYLLHHVCYTQCAMLDGDPYTLHIWCCCCIPMFCVLAPHSYRTSVHFYSVLQGVQICSI